MRWCHRATVRSRRARPVAAGADVAAFIAAARGSGGDPLGWPAPDRDGLLLDITDSAAAMGLMLPAAVSRAVYEDCVAWAEDDNARKGTDQHAEARLEELLWAVRGALLAGPVDGPLDRAVHLMRVPRAGPGRAALPVTLRVLVQADEQGEWALTVLAPGDP